jgi:hypothetical protein
MASSKINEINVEIPLPGKPIEIDVNVPIDGSPTILFQASSMLNQLLLLLLKYLGLFIPLILFFSIYILVIVLLQYQIRQKFPDVKEWWFFGKQKVAFDRYFNFTVATITELNREECSADPNSTRNCFPSKNDSEEDEKKAKENAKKLKINDSTYTMESNLPDYILNELNKKDPNVGFQKTVESSQKAINDKVSNVPGASSLSSLKDMGSNLTDTVSKDHTKDLYLVGDVINLGKKVESKIISSTPKKYVKLVNRLLIFAMVAIGVFILYRIRGIFTVETDVRILTIWEDRWDFNFYIVGMGLIVRFLISCIIVKHAAAVKNPITHPFMTLYMNGPNYRKFVEFQKHSFSDSRKQNGLEGFAPSPESTFDYDQVKDKMKAIHKKRKSNKKPKETEIHQGFDVFNGWISRGIQSIERAFEYVIYKTYLSGGGNTVVSSISAKL